MATTKTLVDQIECTASRIVQVRFKKLVVTDDGQELACAYHRTVIAPGTDVDLQMAAVNTDLARMGYPPVSQDEIGRIKRIAAVEHA